jgi:hypothetical protein
MKGFPPLLLRFMDLIVCCPCSRAKATGIEWWSEWLRFRSTLDRGIVSDGFGDIFVEIMAKSVVWLHAHQGEQGR